MNTDLIEAGVFSARALLDEVREGVVVFDGAGSVVYTNRAARQVLGSEADFGRARADELVPRLLALGGRRSDAPDGLEAVLFPVASGDSEATLAERERRAIVEMLERSNGRLAETARRLGISRTTLWRRLREYGLRSNTGPR
jgi:transcriptional regulator of acetoin/glycerol metabolism